LEPEPRASSEKLAGESTAQFAGVLSACDAEEPFSLRRGLDFELELLKLGITSVPSFGGRLRKRRRRPVWVALDWLGYAASELARTPPSEGVGIVPALRDELLPGWQDHDEARRFGREPMDVD
jgi:hypothetical protein